MKTANAGTQKQAGNLINKIVSTVAILLLLGGIGLATWFFVFYHNHEETNDAQIEQYVTPVISRITGYVQEVRFEENQYVHKGDTLLVIDNREYKSRLQMAEAELATARVTEGVMEKGATAVQSNTAIRQAQLDAAKAQLWKAEQDYKRYGNLLQEEAATEQQFEQMKATYESAKAHYAEIANSIQSSEYNTAEALSKVPAAATAIKAREAAVDNAALFYSYTVITAPYNGWVGRKTLQPGQLVKEGQTLVSVVSEEKWITANFKETQVSHLTAGQQVIIKADATGKTIIHGTIESFSPASGARFSLLPPDNSTGNFVKIEQRIPVRIHISERDSATQFLRAGMNVTVTAPFLTAKS
ncbi:HlyD family secretion protein [Deminuibacter soli]|uniref:HlyD family secretion protein n=1 Tax=Deminuibacter soli TaxID=2291815 RepID=A0A3E1NL33_9BACT|nr:HlyD family secretion protein [Deminuibacter soli]RFM28650.1 HlyD family secretion protein [Deminuibacter soli]